MLASISVLNKLSSVKQNKIAKISQNSLNKLSKQINNILLSILHFYYVQLSFRWTSIFTQQNVPWNGLKCHDWLIISWQWNVVLRILKGAAKWFEKSAAWKIEIRGYLTSYKKLLNTRIKFGTIIVTIRQVNFVTGLACWHVFLLLFFFLHYLCWIV